MKNTIVLAAALSFMATAAYAHEEKPYAFEPLWLCEEVTDIVYPDCIADEDKSDKAIGVWPFGNNPDGDNTQPGPVDGDDGNNGHGNDPDGRDDSNPGKSKDKPKKSKKSEKGKSK